MDLKEFFGIGLCPLLDATLFYLTYSILLYQLKIVSLYIN